MLKNYFIGIFPDERTIHKIDNLVTANLKPLFETQTIPIKFVSPDKYHISVLYVGHNISPVRKYMIKRVLSRRSIPQFLIGFNTFRLGISSKYKELLFLNVERGADELRDIVYAYSEILKIQREEIFIPHVTIGRINKDLTNEEYNNLTNEIDQINNTLVQELKDIAFKADQLIFVESDLRNYRAI